MKYELKTGKVRFEVCAGAFEFVGTVFIKNRDPLAEYNAFNTEVRRGEMIGSDELVTPVTLIKKSPLLVQFGEMNGGDTFLHHNDELCFKFERSGGVNATCFGRGETYDFSESTLVRPVSGKFVEDGA